MQVGGGGNVFFPYGSVPFAGDAVAGHAEDPVEIFSFRQIPFRWIDGILEFHGLGHREIALLSLRGDRVLRRQADRLLLGLVSRIVPHVPADPLAGGQCPRREDQGGKQRGKAAPHSTPSSIRTSVPPAPESAPAARRA